MSNPYHAGGHRLTYRQWDGDSSFTVDVGDSDESEVTIINVVNGSFAILRNQTGADQPRGAVVIVDVAHDESFVLSTAPAQTERSIGVLLEPIADGVRGMVQTHGYCSRVNVTGEVVIGDKLYISTEGGLAAIDSARSEGAFAEALTDTAVEIVQVGGACESSGALLAASGTASGFYEWYACDLDDETGWGTNGFPVNGQYWGRNYNEPVTASQARIYQDLNAANAATTVKLYGTDDSAKWAAITGSPGYDFDAAGWTLIDTLSGLTTGDQTIAFTESTYQYWMWRATAGGGNGWSSYELGLYLATPTDEAVSAILWGAPDDPGGADTHIADATDAHDASAISILDTAADFTATDVEGALAEIQSDNEAHVAAADPHTGYVREAEFTAAGDSLVGTGAGTLIKRKHNESASAAPTVNDDSGDGYEVGSHWLDTTNDKEYVLLDATVGAAVWKERTNAAGGGSTINVEDEGSPLSTAADTLNFTGAGVAASGTGTTKTINIPGSGGGWADALVERASGSDASDDEFDDGSFSGYTTVETAAHGIVETELGDVLSITHDSTSDGSEGVHARLIAIPGTPTAPITISAGVRLLVIGGGYPGLGIGFANGTTYGAGAQIRTGTYSRGSSSTTPPLGVAFLKKMTNFNTDAGGYSEVDVYGLGQVAVHLRCVWSAANTWEAYISADGVSWKAIATGVSYTMTPTHFGLFFATGGSTSAPIFTWDYFRVA